MSAFIIENHPNTVTRGLTLGP